MTLSYDALADCLYVTISECPPMHYLCVEGDDDIALKVHKDPMAGYMGEQGYHSVVGATIPFFSKRGKVSPPDCARLAFCKQVK